MSTEMDSEHGGKDSFEPRRGDDDVPLMASVRYAREF
jgi:hypothetical protein